MNISTAEAALRLGISEATVKRRLAERELPGAKVGGRWIVYGDQLSSPAIQQPAASQPSSTADVGRAFQQVRANDRKDLWVPDILNWSDYGEDPSAILERAGLKCQSTSPIADPVETVEVPKGAYLTRAGALLTLEDRVAYQALCNELAPDIESRLSDRTFSARLAPAARPRDFLLPGVKQWTKFLEATKTAQAIGGPWVVSTDLASYFDSISHRLLFRELENLGPGHEQTLKSLRRLLDQWREDSHHGLPTGPEASRLLGNFFLARVDAFMVSKGFEYFRYMDDVRIIAPTRDRALHGLRLFEIECRKLGLIVSTAKTEVSREPIATRDFVLDAAGYFFQNRLDEARPVLRELLQDALEEERPKVKHAKFALLRLAALVDAPALEPVLQRLRSLQEAAPESATYLRAFISDRAVQTALSEYLIKTPEPVLEVYQHAWLMAAMLEALGRTPTDWVAYGTTIAENQNWPAYLRILALNLMAKSANNADIEKIRSMVRMTYDPSVLRGGVVALARAGSLDGQTVSLVESRAPHLACTLSYLKGRKSLPSLVQESLWSSIQTRRS